MTKTDPRMAPHAPRFGVEPRDRAPLGRATPCADAGRERVVRRLGPGRLRALLEDLGQSAALAEEGLEPREVALLRGGGEARKIVAVTCGPEFPEALMRQALGLAERLGAEVAGLCVRRETGPDTPAGERARLAFAGQCEARAGDFRAMARAMGVSFRLEVGFGPTAEAVEALCSRLRRVEFVLAVRGGRCPALRVSMPVFEVAPA